MKLSESGIRFLESLEGKRNKLYDDKYGCTIDCAADAAGYPTIGVGHLVQPGDTQFDGITLSDNEIDELLRGDIEVFEDCVNDNVKQPLTQNQFDALICLAFNIGVTNFKGSTLLRRINAGRYDEAAEQFLVWNKSKGKYNEGLANRRVKERQRFLSA